MSYLCVLILIYLHYLLYASISLECFVLLYYFLTFQLASRYNYKKQTSCNSNKCKKISSKSNYSCVRCVVQKSLNNTIILYLFKLLNFFYISLIVLFYKFDSHVHLSLKFLFHVLFCIYNNNNIFQEMQESHFVKLKAIVAVCDCRWRTTKNQTKNEKQHSSYGFTIRDNNLRKYYNIFIM